MNKIHNNIGQIIYWVGVMLNSSKEKHKQTDRWKIIGLGHNENINTFAYYYA